MKNNQSSLSGESRIGYGLVLPYIANFAVFLAFPLVFSVVLVFHRWDILSPMQWIGLGNFQILLRDKLFFKSIANTLVFLAIHIPLQIGLALLLAELLHRTTVLKGFFRASVFLPVVVSGVVISVLWGQLFAEDSGMINRMLTSAGAGRVSWLTSPNMAMISIALVATWKNVGLYTIFFLIGLQSVPVSLYEAAAMDGAGAFRRFFSITFPAINPMFFMVVVLSTIGGFSLFVEPVILTGGGPMNSTLSAMLYIYKQGFTFYHMGYAATLGLTVALMIFAVVLVQRQLVERRDEND
jgi:multiple sugar transport system permease protein